MTSALLEAPREQRSTLAIHERIENERVANPSQRPAIERPPIERLTVEAMLTPKLGSFEEAWSTLDRVSRKDGDEAMLALTVKRALSGVHNLIRLCGEVAPATPSPEFNSERLALQRKFAVKSSEELLNVADQTLLGVSNACDTKFTLMRVIRSLQLVKNIAERGNVAQASSLMSKIEGAIQAEIA